MDFKDYLEKSAKEIDREVEKILNKEIEEAKKIDQKLVPFLEAFAESCKGGKRIRGTLVMLGYELEQNNMDSRLRGNDILRIAAAYEIFHAAILAHDDIMDNSPMRRNQPSLYKKVGVSEAITLGDYGFFLAMKIISNSLFAKLALDTTIGQLLDLKKANPIITARLKTARYTIAGPLQLGAILGGLSPTSPRLNRIKQFGENLGIAFQIRDDILDGQDTKIDAAEKYLLLARKIIPELTKDKNLNTLITQMAKYMVERIK